MKRRVGIYPGSFNPWHKGHNDVLEKASKCFDNIVILYCYNPDKEVFGRQVVGKIVSDHNERLGDKAKNHVIRAHQWEGTLKDAAEHFKADGIIRGLRNGHDLQYEMNNQYWNEDVGIKIPFMYFITDRSLGHISSSAIRAADKIGVEHGYTNWEKI